MISSIKGTRLIGKVSCKIEGHFKRPMALSTRMSALAIFFILATSSGFCCSMPLLDEGISDTAYLWIRPSLIIKPLSARIKSPGSIKFKNPDSRVICTSHMHQTKTYVSIWWNIYKKFNCIMTLVFWPCQRLNLQVPLFFNKYLCTVNCAS